MKKLSGVSQTGGFPISGVFPQKQIAILEHHLLELGDGRRKAKIVHFKMENHVLNLGMNSDIQSPNFQLLNSSPAVESKNIPTIPNTLSS